MPGTKLFYTSRNIVRLIATEIKKKEKKEKEPDEYVLDTMSIIDQIPIDVLARLNDNEVQMLKKINNVPNERAPTSQKEAIELPDIFVENHEGIFHNIPDMNTIGYIDTDIADHYTDIVDQDATIDINSIAESNHTESEMSEEELSRHDIKHMLDCLQESETTSMKWKDTNVYEFETLLKDPENLSKVMTKAEMTMCLTSIADRLAKLNICFSKYWNKSKLAELLKRSTCMSGANTLVQSSKRKRRRNPKTLVNICKSVINKLPKSILNAVMAEHEMIDRVKDWRNSGPFPADTQVGTDKVTWFSLPEYNSGTLSYIFSFIDVHHLITNCRVKVCKDGIPERGMSKQAWIDVARTNTTNLRIPHVEDLVDKQSDSIARETFSENVERTMRARYPREAQFCKLVREFYEAEDDPGISAENRCLRRMALRTWLLDGVNFCYFPPYGSHIRGIPNVMFQGFLTNIERRIQIFPYVKSGNYNVRSLGSLEAENLFGQFQDIDPKGSGVLKAGEVPAALETACQLLKVRLTPDRPFHMSLSTAKVYPVHDLLTESETEHIPCSLYVYPSLVNHICVRDHMFDSETRAKRKAKRRLVDIKGPNDAARGVSGVRQYHKCDESKILPHKRLGIDI